jgi:hypothetical protein
VLLPFERYFIKGLQRRKITLSEADFKIRELRNTNAFRAAGDDEQTTIQLAAEAAYISFVAHYLEYAGPTINGIELLNAASDLVAPIDLKNIPLLPCELAAKLRVSR